MSASEYQIEMHGITKIYDGVNVLTNVDFNVKRGEIHALMGENGAGKSTLIKILAGARCPDGGEIFINGEKVKILNPKSGINHGISVIYQEFELVGDLSVAENIFLDEFRKGSQWVNWSDKRKRARAYLEELGFGEINENAKVRDLSVAFQQVIEICKALSRNSSTLVLDEPTSVLTTTEVEKLFVLIKSLKEKGVAIIYISHRLEEVFELSDRITVLRDGELVGTVETSAIDKQKLVNMMIGRELQTFFPKRVSNIGKMVLKVEHVRAGKLVKDVSFSVNEGEVLGISGLVGAGRTEAFRAIVGADKLDGGHVYMNDKEIKIKTPKDAIKHGIGLLAEDRKCEGLLINLSIRMNLTLPCLKNISGTLGFINKRKEHEYVDEMVKKLNILLRGTTVEYNVSNLSGGNRQKVAIAKLLSSNCKVLILDEPTRGVDVGAKIEIFNIINSLVAQGYAVVMISSEMAEIIGMCDRVVVVKDGETVGELGKDELSEQNVINYIMGVNA